MIENIWAGWRAEYLADPERRGAHAAGSSVFTRLLQSGESDEALHIVHRSETSFVILNRYPYSVGHLLVVPLRQMVELEDLDAHQTVDLWGSVTLAVRALKDEYQPAGINVGINLGASAGGSVRDHLHVHVVPRWTGDANFLVATAATKAIPEALDVTARRIRSAFGRIV